MTNLSASLENYLEAIFHIEQKKKAAMAKDIAERMEVNSSSVTGALRALGEKGLVNYTPYNLITLTPKGRRAARDVVRRHEGIREFFVKILAVDEASADEVACRMEHCISPDILDRFARFVAFIENCPEGGAERIKSFAKVCQEGQARETRCKEQSPA